MPNAQIQIHKYTNRQKQHITKCQKDPTCGIFLKRGFSESSMYHLYIVSAPSVHHQHIISASSAHHWSVFIAELSPVYCCLVSSTFAFLCINICNICIKGWRQIWIQAKEWPLTYPGDVDLQNLNLNKKSKTRCFIKFLLVGEEGWWAVTVRWQEEGVKWLFALSLFCICIFVFLIEFACWFRK